MENTHKEKLLEEKKRLEKALSHIGRRTEIPGDWEATPEDMGVSRADMSEVADEMEEYETRIAETAALEEELAEVSAALLRINAGSYGLCRICGGKIEGDRLAANPAATTCKIHLANNN